jgi:methionyl-tRNA formyltransferase
MRIVFMGTPEFAVPSLKILIENGYDVVGVITSTDKYGGRGKKQLLQSAVKKYAQLNELNILQPKNLKSPEFVEELRALKADLQVVVAFRMLPEVVWNMPPLGTMNLHASLLPKYRGAAPINWAIVRGEKQTGLTSFLLQHAIDTGDMIDQVTVPILPDDTAGDLHDRMMPVGAELVLKSAKMIESGQINMQVQDSSKVTKAPKIHHEDCAIDFAMPVAEVYNFIRGMAPYPAAWTHIDGKEVKILGCRYHLSEKPEFEPGTIESDQKTMLKIHCLDGVIEVLKLKMEGKRALNVADFLNGYQIMAKSVEQRK